MAERTGTDREALEQTIPRLAPERENLQVLWAPPLAGKHRSQPVWDLGDRDKGAQVQVVPRFRPLADEVCIAANTSVFAAQDVKRRDVRADFRVLISDA